MALNNKDAFSWTLEEAQAIEQLKDAICIALVLTTPEFTKTFIVESDSLVNGIGFVLMQE